MFRSLLKEKCLEDGQSNSVSAEDVKSLLVSKLNQNNRSQLMTIVFHISIHFCVYPLSATILNTILICHTLRNRVLKSPHLKWWNEMKCFCSADKKSKMLFQTHSCPDLTRSQALSPTELFIQQSDICFPNHRRRHPKDEKLSPGTQSTGKATWQHA